MDTDDEEDKNSDFEDNEEANAPVPESPKLSTSKLT